MKQFLHENAAGLLLTFLAPCLFLAVFLLYGLEIRPFLYVALLYELLWLAGWGIRYLLDRKAHRNRVALHKAIRGGTVQLPEFSSRSDADWSETVRDLCGEIRSLTDAQLRERQDARDYYTLWVHQIKTPIAAMRMQLQSEDIPGRELLEAELFRVEQYAEMALQYIRLEESESDLDFREQPLDDIIRSCIRKFAPMFIAKKLSLRYEGTDLSVLTDAKWLAFMLEQLLSNAIKYTPSGSVTVTVSEDQCLTVSDTGIGIAPEDLPRVFEKGFTGQNGRLDRKATGLGLYLCGLAAKKLGIALSAESTVRKGSAFTLRLEKDPIRAD